MAKTIKDPEILGNYEIQVDGSFALVKIGMTTPKEGEEAKATAKNCGYFSTIQGALNEASKLVAQERLGNVCTLREYIEAISASNEKIERLFDSLNL